ncbi:uncharacterized protein G2W53_012591 [Senna tora]|uniref:Uncharacterized protein n=1 Tax=Senna tora TaxID=362788 RepID=A0A834TXB3_9FABA|nr:uncharacterized protein G2W53_012591 [Senna tora]
MAKKNEMQNDKENDARESERVKVKLGMRT